MSNGQANSLSAHSPTVGHAQSRAESGTCRMEKCSPGSAAFPPHSPPTSVPSLFEWFLGTMPQCDSSETYTRAVWPRPSPAVLRLTFAAGISEVSRFSCMKFLGVLWGLRLRRTETRTRGSALVPIAFRALQRRRRPDCQFSELHTHPADSPVYASPSTSRCPVQNSGPSGSLVLSREASSSSASCRFSPAHCNGLFSTVDIGDSRNL